MRAFIAWFVLACSTVSVWGQTPFTGRVLDALDGTPLPGATVAIDGTSTAIATAADGTFRLAVPAAPNPQVRVSFIGYEDRVEPLRVDMEIRLIRSTTELLSAVVQERASGIARAMRDQQLAPNIMQVVSAEQIRSFPDLNAADAMQRVTGVTLQRDQGEGRYVQLRGTPAEFTNFNVNGIQLPSPESSIRTIGMDVINASQIESIEVSKVLTPDMNGDAIGGTVNLVTKRAQSSEPEFNLVLAGGLNFLRNTPNAEAQFTFSTRKGRLGFLVNANYNRTQQGADNLEFKYEKGPFFGASGQDNYYLQYTEVQLRHYTIDRERLGLSTTLDLDLPGDQSLCLSGMFNRYADDELRRRKVFSLDDALSERTYLYGGIEHDVKDRLKDQTLSSINLSGEHLFGWLSLDWEAAWSTAAERQPDRMEGTFENPGQAIFIEFDGDDPQFPQPAFTDPDNSALATAYDRYELDKLIFERHEAADRNLIGRFDATLPTGEFFEWKAGALVRSKRKFRDITASSFGRYSPSSNMYPIWGDTLSLAGIDNGWREDDLLGRGYVMEAMPDPDQMRAFYEQWPTLFIYGSEGITETRERTYGQDYAATEDVLATYAMGRFAHGPWEVIGGVRREITRIAYEGVRIDKTTSGFFAGMDTIRDNRVVPFVLPNLQGRYALSERTNLRAAWTYSYARPNFRDVIPYRIQQERSEVRWGNPGLAYPLSRNLDLLYETYWGGRNVLSLGVFHKQIDSFVFNYQIIGYEGDPTQANFSKVQLELPLNGLDGEVFGAEFTLQAMFDRLRGKASNLGIFANYTFTHSVGRIGQRYPANTTINILTPNGDYSDYFNPDAVEEIPLPGQAPHTMNAALFYDTPDVYAKISVNFADRFLYQLGVDSDLDEYYGQAWRVDFNGYVQVAPTIQIFGDVRNLTNAPLIYFLGSPEDGRIRQTEFYSSWARLGIRAAF